VPPRPAAAPAAAAAGSSKPKAAQPSKSTAVVEDDEEIADDVTDYDNFANVSTVHLEAMGLIPHPSPACEAASLSSVPSPDCDYVVKLPSFVLQSECDFWPVQCVCCSWLCAALALLLQQQRVTNPHQQQLAGAVQSEPPGAAAGLEDLLTHHQPPADSLPRPASACSPYLPCAPEHRRFQLLLILCRAPACTCTCTCTHSRGHLCPSVPGCAPGLCSPRAEAAWGGEGRLLPG
jgi:hypothetical protein